MVSLSPRSAQGVTVTVGPPGATQCHCSSRGLSHRVTVSARCRGCHTMLCHCVAHGVSPTVTAGPQCITQCHCHCMAHGVSPTVTVTAQPGVPHTVTVQDTPQCQPLHTASPAPTCHCALLPVTSCPHRPWGTPATAQLVPAAQIPPTPTPCVPGDAEITGHVPEPVPSASRAAVTSQHSPLALINSRCWQPLIAARWEGDGPRRVRNERQRDGDRDGGCVTHTLPSPCLRPGSPRWARDSACCWAGTCQDVAGPGARADLAS